MITAGFVFLALLVAVIVLDLCKRYTLTCKPVMALHALLLPHGLLFAVLGQKHLDGTLPGAVFYYTSAALLWLYVCCRVHIRPYSRRPRSSTRVRMLFGGKCLMVFSALAIPLQALFYIVMLSHDFFGAELWTVITDAVLTLVIWSSLFMNGVIRILVMTMRVSLPRKVILGFLMLLPPVNVFVLIYLMRVAGEEYEYEENKAECDIQRIETQVCKTKYPLVMAHGIGWHDWRWFNYWGRIPKELKRNGAIVYYGDQEPLGTIEYAGEQLRERVLKIIEETGCEKVNLIGHSKGGLDIRYAASLPDMDKYVASVTTVATPHRGTPVGDKAARMKEERFRRIAAVFDKRFRAFGDSNPDFYGSCMQLTTTYCKEFNERVKDVDGIFYQSYASVMKGVFSAPFLGITYLMTKKAGKNDGLVTVESAMWGEFRGALTNPRGRGISHADTIDLFREDIRGYDPREAYVEIVADLKERGF